MSTKTFLGTVLFELKKTFSDSKHGICQNCYNPNTDRDWCQPCNAEKFRQNFSNWTSGNKHIDMFIQDAQVTASNHDEVLEWIPNDQLNKVTFIANGKYSTNYKAIWIETLFTIS
ncbi:calmodulin-dependent protein kinase [Gigaspora margarita]|uniref:Calmodulin-dependent protein kinase n=1 Tax=Gigaspora margarita TaxID=4874 RepID=A0A8H4ES83_GIGMA|nr:calmodulin-dependent protein kinase [Gigaspora margarita]